MPIFLFKKPMLLENIFLDLSKFYKIWVQKTISTLCVYIMELLSFYLTTKRMAMIHPYVKGRVLDLGCGDANIYAKYSKEMLSYCGIERSSSFVKKLQTKYPHAVFIDRDLDRGELGLAEQYDTIFLVATIEHIWNQKQLFANLVNLLTDKGRIVITTPTVFGNDIVHRIGSKIGLLSKSAADDHIVIYNRKRFEILAYEFHMKIEKYCKFQMFCNQIVVLQKERRVHNSTRKN